MVRIILFPIKFVVMLIMLAFILLMEIVNQSISIICSFKVGKPLTHIPDIIEMFKWTIGK